MPDDPFHIQSVPRTARPLLTWLLRLRTCEALYQQIQLGPADTPFEARALAALNIRPVCSATDIALIPGCGPLLVAANHPHGALDGLLLASVIRRVRPDVRILANHMLSRIPELAEVCFFIDPFGGAAAAARSQAGLRAAHLWLRNGGALVAFPAGEVAHDRVGSSRVDLQACKLEYSIVSPK